MECEVQEGESKLVVAILKVMKNIHLTRNKIIVNVTCVSEEGVNSVCFCISLIDKVDNVVDTIGSCTVVGQKVHHFAVNTLGLLAKITVLLLEEWVFGLMKLYEVYHNVFGVFGGHHNACGGINKLAKVLFVLFGKVVRGYSSCEFEKLVVSCFDVVVVFEETFGCGLGDSVGVSFRVCAADSVVEKIYNQTEKVRDVTVQCVDSLMRCVRGVQEGCSSSDGVMGVWKYFLHSCCVGANSWRDKKGCDEVIECDEKGEGEWRVLGWIYDESGEIDDIIESESTYECGNEIEEKLCEGGLEFDTAA